MLYSIKLYTVKRGMYEKVFYWFWGIVLSTFCVMNNATYADTIDKVVMTIDVPDKTPAGDATVDPVTLLSYQELIKYMPTDAERKTKPTEYAISMGCYLNPDGDAAWWLRSPGSA